MSVYAAHVGAEHASAIGPAIFSGAAIAAVLHEAKSCCLGCHCAVATPWPAAESGTNPRREFSGWLVVGASHNRNI